ncbi:MAG TPA: hypothetical protein PKE20_07210 [Promineifilum sp.]|nr:hypothetical protein [Promineifilum sp.]
MKVADIAAELPREARQRPYIRRLEIHEQTSSLIKTRLIISPDIFVQIYRNDRFDSTNLALIHNQRRIYGRDHLGSSWHRHITSDPSAHDRSIPGRIAVTLSVFLDEVESVMAELGLP